MPNYSGKWNLQSQLQGIKANTWTGIPVFELYAWGANGSGQLGLDDTANSSSPIQIGGRSVPFFETIAAGRSASFGVKSDGTLWSWGVGTNGQTGQGSLTQLSSPTQIGALTNWSTVTATIEQAGSGFAIKTDGTLWAWGNNNLGQLGLGDAINVSSPVQVGTNTDWASVSCFSNNTIATTTSGEIYSWGNSNAGGTGQNTTVIDYSSPVQIGSDTDWGSISTGFRNSASVKTDGTLWTWGNNSPNGPLGIGTTNDTSSPVQVGALTNWASVSCGYDHMLAIKTDGTLWAWGEGDEGKLGQGSQTDTSSPVQVGALTDWAKVNAGEDFSTAIKTDGTLWAWGLNNTGQLGNSATGVTNNSPINIGSLTTWEDVSAGRQHTLGLIRARTGMS